MSKLTTIVDTEIYQDYFLAGFKDTLSGRYVDFEMYEGKPLDLVKLSSFMRRFRLITFNGSHFDIPILALALTGADCALLKKACDAIINGNMKSWIFEKAFGVRIPKLDHIDLIDVAPGIASLKVYGGRLHAPKMQDLPIEPNELILPEERPIIVAYNHNDLDTTEALFNKMAPQISLRERMTEHYGVDLRSKSDAQIAEAVLASQVEKITGVKPERPEILPGTIYHYRAPDWVAFRGEALRDMLADVQRAEFRVIDNGSIVEPPELKGRKVKIGRGVYRMGIGGLHSSETRAAHVAGPDEVIADTDVVSYYPALILAQGLAPRQMGAAFTQAYRSIVRQRVAAKAAGDKVTADVLKIVVNGSFGKFGSKWSKLYAPDLLIQTTVTGQLALLMLIELLEEAGIEVLSANTDGIVTRCKPRRGRHDDPPGGRVGGQHRPGDRAQRLCRAVLARRQQLLRPEARRLGQAQGRLRRRGAGQEPPEPDLRRRGAGLAARRRADRQDDPPVPRPVEVRRHPQGAGRRGQGRRVPGQGRAVVLRRRRDRHDQLQGQRLQGAQHRRRAALHGDAQPSSPTTSTTAGTSARPSASSRRSARWTGGRDAPPPQPSTTASWPTAASTRTRSTRAGSSTARPTAGATRA
jgi:hypothetical protein